MGFEVRAAKEEEIEWLKAQLDPPTFYLEKFQALKKKYGAIELDSPNKAARLKTGLKRAITTKQLKIRVFTKESVVLLIDDDAKEVVK